jgi:hypothetical protein
MQARDYRSLAGSLLGCLLAFAGNSLSAAAQTTAPGEWTWMGGSNTANQYYGVYGTLGIRRYRKIEESS